jgi:hypothetical protein
MPAAAGAHHSLRNGEWLTDCPALRFLSLPRGLRRLNSKVQAALRDIEDAEAALDAIYEQGLDIRAVQAGYLSLARKLR